MTRSSRGARLLPSIFCSLACSASAAREPGPSSSTGGVVSSDGNGAASASGTAGPAVSPVISFPTADQLPPVEVLPDPLAFADGARVTSRADWLRRRSELIRQIEHYEYGALPETPTRVEVLPDTKGGGRDRQLTVVVSAGGRRSSFPIRLRLPAGDGPFPTFVGPAKGVRTGKLDDARFVARGFAVVEVGMPSVAADDASRNGAFYTLFPESGAGVLAAWAWGFSRSVDALATVPEVDGTQLAVTGHSRLGKAALLASVLDERFALTIPAAAGLAGTAGYRFFYEADGENEKIEDITKNFPYWFSPVLRDFVGRPERLPFDQHSVMALVAPRLLLTTIGTGDAWGNPQGTQLAYLGARRVYQFLGAPDRIALHYRPGGHSMNDEDFTAMMDYADLHFRGRKPSVRFDALPYPEDPQAMPWAALARDPE